MNWVGGTRNRLRAKSEKKRQKEFFEKQKYARRMRLHQRGEGSKNDPSPSLDIISLQMAHLTAQQFKSIDTDKNSKPLKKVNMDRPCKNDFHIQRRHHNVELPTSPYSTPSILQLSDDIPSRRDLPSGSIQAPRASTSALSECSKSFTSHQHHRLQENRSQAFCSHTSSRQTSRDSADDLTVSHSQVSGKKRISVDSMRMPSRFSESAILAKQNTFFLHDHAVKGRKSFSDSSIRQHERFSHDIRTPVKLPVETREGQYSEHTMTGMRRSGEGIPTGQRRYSDSPKADQQKPTGGLLEVQKRSSEDLFFQFTSVAQQSMRVTSSASSQIRQRRASSSTEMSMSTDSSDDCKIYTPEKYKQTQRCCRTDDVRNPGKENAKDQSKCESSYCDSCSYPHVIKKGNLETSRNYIRVEGDYKSIGSSEPHSSGIAGSPSSSTNIPDPVHAPGEPPSNTESKSSIDLLCHEVTNFTSPESDYGKNRGMQPNEIGQQLSQQHKGLHQHTLHTPCVLSTDNKPSSTKKIRSSSNSSLSSLGDGFPRTVLQEVLELDADLNRRCSSPGIYGDIDELSSPKKRRKPNALFVESFNTYDMVSVGSHSSSSDSCITPPPEQSQRQNQSNPEYAVSGRTLSPFSNDVQQRALESIALSTPENLQEKNGDNLRNSKIAETYKQSQMKSQVKSLPADTNFTGSGMDQQQCPGSKENDFIGSGTNQLQVLSSSSSDQCIESRLDQLQHLGSEEDQYKDQIKSHDHASTDHHGIIKHEGMQCESVSVKTSVSEQATQCDISVSAVCNDTSTQTQDTLRCDVSTQWEENGNRFCDNEEKIQAEPSISEVEKSEDDVVTSGQQPHQLDIKSLMATTETLKYQQNAVLDESHKTCMFPSEDKVVEEVSVALDDELSKDEERKDKDDEMMQGDVVFVRKMEAESTDVQLNENSADSQCSMLSDSVNLFSIESSTSGTFDSCKSG